MSRRHSLVAAVLLVAIGLAGCAQQGAQDGYELTVADAPSQAQRGDNVTVSFDVDGPEAQATSAAVHFGLSSAANVDDVSADDYAASSPTTSGSVPGTLEVTFPVDFPGTIYYRAQATVDGTDHWSSEKTIQVGGTPVEVVDAPATVEAGPDNVTVAWRVHHIATLQIPHTAVHYGAESQDVDTKGGNPFAYPEIAPKPAHSGEIPGSFSAEIPAEQPGDIYLRGHAVIDGTNWLSSQNRIEVVDPSTPNVVVLDHPGQVEVNETFNVSIQVNAPSTQPTTHVGIETSNESHGPNVSNYDEGPHEPAAAVPGSFTFQLNATEPGTLYLRGHYRNGTLEADDVLSREVAVAVMPETSIRVTDAPGCVETDADGNATVEATFRVDAPNQTSQHLGLHWDTTSHPGDAEADDYNNTGPHDGGDIPGTFTRQFNVTETGTYHYRAHALIDGGDTSLLSAEQDVDVEDSCGPTY